MLASIKDFCERIRSHDTPMMILHTQLYEQSKVDRTLQKHY